MASRRRLRAIGREIGIPIQRRIDLPRACANCSVRSAVLDGWLGMGDGMTGVLVELNRFNGRYRFTAVQLPRDQAPGN